jgi:hypothetical protein
MVVFLPSHEMIWADTSWLNMKGIVEYAKELTGTIIEVLERKGKTRKEGWRELDIEQIIDTMEAKVHKMKVWRPTTEYQKMMLEEDVKDLAAWNTILYAKIQET